MEKEKMIFAGVDFDEFKEDGMDTSMDMAEYCGYVYVGHVAFQLLKTIEDDRLLEVTVMLTEEEVDEETYGEDIIFVDTTNGENAVAIIDSLILDIDEITSEEMLKEYIVKEIEDFIENYEAYDIKSKIEKETICFYDC